MKQLYIIGILSAVILLVLLGLNKLSSAPTSSTAPDEVAEEITLTENVGEEVTLTEDVAQVEEEPLDTNNTNEPMDTPTENTTVVMKTNMGDIVIELYTAGMPITAGNFLDLAQKDFYDSTKFHRVIPGFMIQGGDPFTKDDSLMAQWGTGDPDYKIEDEHIPGFSNVRGTLSMANSGPQSGGSQFFINVADNTNLDFDKGSPQSKHPVFGRVAEGMDIVDAIANTPTGARDIPVQPVIIEDIEIL